MHFWMPQAIGSISCDGLQRTNEAIGRHNKLWIGPAAFVEKMLHNNASPNRGEFYAALDLAGDPLHPPDTKGGQVCLTMAGLDWTTPGRDLASSTRGRGARDKPMSCKLSDFADAQSSRRLRYKTTPAVGAAIDEISPKSTDCVFYEPRGVYAAAKRAIESRARSRLLTLDFRTSGQFPGPRNWAMAGASMGSGPNGEAPEGRD